MNGSRHLRLVFKLTVTAAILVLLYTRVPVSEVWAALTLADLPWVLGAALVSMGMHVLTAWRLALLSRQQGFVVSFADIWTIELTSLFYRVFVPGGTLASLAVRFLKLQKLTSEPSRALACVAADRFFATVALLLVGVVFVLWNERSLLNQTALILLILLLTVLLGYAAAVSGRLREILVAALERMRLPRLAGVASRVLAPLVEFGGLRSGPTLAVTGLSFASQLLGIVAFAMVATSLDLEVEFSALGWIRTMVILATMLPVSFLGLGIRDVALLTLLRGQGVPAELSLAMAVLVFFSTVLFIAAVGGLLEARQRLTGRR